MKTFAIAVLAGFLYFSTNAQTITELYRNKDFQGLIKFENQAEKLSGDELYMIGYAFFRLELDDKAIAFYDLAIRKGSDDGGVHFYKGLSLYYLKKYEEALHEVDVALAKEPSNQEYMNQKGLIYNEMGQEDKALSYFLEATKLPNTFGEPFYWVANYYHGKKEFKKALSLYYAALDKIPKENSHYIMTLQYIGRLEYSFTKNYLNAVNAYLQAIQLQPKNYELYSKLIKAYNGAKAYSKADSLFEKVKIAYRQNELSEDDMAMKSISIDESEWKGQTLVVYKQLVEPKESLDIFYKIYLLTKSDNKIARTFMVEQTIQLPDGAKYLLCERNKETGSHITYPYGWKTDDIQLDDLKESVKLVLDEKMPQGASSSFNE